VQETYKSQPDTPTSISEHLTANENSNTQIYNLQGTCLGKMENYQSLPKGLYLVNGKKIIK